MFSQISDRFSQGIIIAIFVVFTAHRCQGQTWQSKPDVMFVLDSTDTVGASNFETTKQFLKELVQQLNIGSNDIQVSALTYGNGVHKEFDLKDVSNLQDALNRIDVIPFRGGASDASDALKYAHEIGFTGVNGARSGVPHLIIHVTDEPTNDLAATIQEANRAFDKGMVIYSVGVGEGTGKNKLNEVTSDPLSRYLLHADTFSSLKSLVPTLSSRIRNEVPVSSQKLPPPTSCLNKADIVFIADSSDSVGQNDFHHLEDFLKDFIIQLPIDPNGVRVGLLQFANYPSLEFGLDTYTEKISLLRAIDSLNFMGGSSNTADAINYATDEVFQSKVGARYQVPHIAIVITDGQSTDDVSTIIAADRARSQGISLLAVGVGQNVDLTDLEDIADDPDPGHIFQSTSYKDLKTLSKQILDASCNLTRVATAPPTLPPGVTTADPCFDIKDNCPYYSKDTCTNYPTWAKTNCNKYCGFCQASAPSLNCVDDVKCSDYGGYVCTDNSYVGWARQHCRQYCGFCPKEAKTSGFYGKCFYKGREYNHGEKWDDGCDYECICEDGETGAYRCYNKCPVYKNMPKECTVIAVPNECCLKPVCDFKQTLQSRQGSGKGYNPQGVEMCEYAGKQYYDGQTWEVGCDLRCTCTDASSGIHVCQSYCPTYQSLPNNCRLTKKPGDCCASPVCEFETVTGIVTGDGSVSGNGVGAPTPDRSCDNKLTDCRAYGKAACREYPEWAKDKCALFCNVCVVKTPVSKADDFCRYDGKQYSQNATWSVGCDTDCICEVAAYGYYRCINKCPDYSDIPRGCTRQKKVGECCPVITCNNVNFAPSATNVNSLGNGGGLTMVDPNGNEIDVLPTVPSNTSLTPGAGRGPQLSGCLYRGKVYVQGQQWEVGCNLNCLCVNANTGVYECRERCPKYDNVPATCQLLPDPSDPCCTFPTNCGPNPYIPIPVYAKGVTNVGAVMTPSITDLIYGHYTTQFTVTFAGITLLAPTPPVQAGLGYCLYKGVTYKQGETWKDGCDFNCVCEDGLTGSYRCVEQCQHYVDLPPQYCHLEADPSNPCCSRPVCNFTAGYDVLKGRRNETLTTESTTVTTPTTPTTTVAPPKQKTSTQAPIRRALCQYKGTYYTQGQTWFDGCDYKCSCDKADENVYTCLQRCPSYSGDFTNCTQISDPSDPQCCTMPQCQGRGLPPGQFFGQNRNNGTDKCLYKGVEYSDGDVWEDVCQYQCECTDSSVGLYQCANKCPSYPNLPSSCKLVQDFASPCCKIPQCTPTPAPTPGSNINTPMCDYFGAKYSDGQTWIDGCDFNCQCENATEGLYTCTQRCPSYPNLPFDCQLVTDDQDPCCEKPKCTTSTPGPNQVPTLPPGKIEGNALVPNPGMVPVPGQKPSPGLIPNRNSCVYDGQEYTQDEEWFDGCDYGCQCKNATIGAYTCVERCPKYSQLPPQCTLMKDAANPCCQIALCDPNYSTAVPNTQSTLVPGKLTTITPPIGDFCVYNGQYYADGQTWYDGCDFKCVCEDAKAGTYRCTDRCPIQPLLPQGCTNVPDPGDPVCCEVPSCTYTTVTPGQKGTLVPSIPPAVVTGRQITPSPLPANSPNKDTCLYNRAVYRQGQRWVDGCDFNCECIDGSTGGYKCTEMCPQYASLPPQCVYVQDANNPCCQVPYCDPSFPTPPTLSPQNTLVPGINIDACIYNGVPYKQAERWDDGCDFECVCEDAKGGNYRCDKRCPSYDQIPSGCSLFTDPNDQCCQELICQPNVIPMPNSPLPYPIPVKVPGKTTGQTVSTKGNNPKGCLYNGKVYKQGDSWEDRCDRRCTCLDEDAAVYQCNERCVDYPSIPQNCQLAPDMNDICCEIPKCSNGTNPNPGVPTLVPPQPGRTTLIPGMKDMCEYNGDYYAQGQQWYDGCQKVCVCLNATLNQQSCSSRCLDYSQGNIPNMCQMVPDPNDPVCCEVPQCIPTPGPNGYPAPTTVSPGDPKPTPTVFVNIPGIVTGMAPIPTPTPDPNGGPTPTPRHACVYNGREYRQGMKWQDGCDYNCVCVNETSGLYQCDQRCPSYPIVPVQCQLVQDPNDFCCKQVSCDFSKPTPNPFMAPPTATPDPNTPTPPTLDPNVPTPTPNPNGGIPLATPPTLRPDLAFCVYSGVAYSQGSTWTVGCDTRCKCEDATTNFYTCADRCPTYMNVPTGCSKVVDPSDACCSIVECVPDPNSTPVPNPNTLVPNAGSVPTLVPGVITGKPGPGITGRTVGCIHKGVNYRQGDVWSDGCAYNCECLDDKSGQYKCSERCPKFINVPSFCSLIPDPKDLCCQSLSCLTPSPSPSNISTISPPPGAPTTTPKQTDFCVFDGKSYTQGQVWYDGCDQTCVCEDAKIQYQRCTQRCPEFTNIPPSCTLIPDPKDPTCCQIPQCDPGNVTGYTGKVSGAGTPPTLSMTTLQPVTNDTCYYKGVNYRTGQKWRDGCEYNCECINGPIGFYECTEICPHYANTAQCPVVRDPSNPCCMKPDCVSPTTTPDPNVPASPVPTPYPVSGTTLTPQKAFCVYDGRPYQQYDTWTVACDLSCRCEDAVSGRINCDQRCPVYPNIPTGCEMVTDPYDSCCQLPNCVPQPGQPLNPNATGVVGTITGSRLPVSVPRGPVPDTCIYHGVSYKEGEKWDDGCLYQCECVDGAQGKYVCVERCQQYPVIPKECTLLQDPSDNCCEKLYCGIPTKPATLGTTDPNTPSPLPSLTPTPAAPPSPNAGTNIPTPPIGVRTTVKPPTVDTCEFNGDHYIQGQTWYDGCKTVCSCDNATANFYSCQERCARFPAVPTSCTIVPDPNDPSCCLVPDCPITPQPGVTPTPGVIAPLAPGVVVGVGKVPQPTNAPTPSSYNGTTKAPPTAQPGCVYKGIIHIEGDKWSDNCEWDCVCDDGTTGQYTCTEKCPRVNTLNLPPECKMVQDQNEPCCQATYCNFVNPTPIPTVNTTNNVTVTTTGKGDFCVYNGAFYAEGATWYDGCQFKCTCDDGKNGYYTCNDRCSNYLNLPSSCTLVTDPSDSCCSIPDCQPTPGTTLQPSQSNVSTLTPPMVGTYVLNPQPPATFFGQGGTPSAQPGGNNPNTGFKDSCLYKGNFYTQDQQFQDGCQYSCVCIDASKGRYKCSERCSSYASIPPACTLETDPLDSCCQIPICTPQTPPTTTEVPTPPSTSSMAPPTASGKTTVLPPTKMTKPPNMCLYGNNAYKKGDFWFVPGQCQYACICDDPSRNIYTCHNACPMYTELPTYCQLVTDPKSTCCKKPYCEINGKNVTALIPIGTTDVFGSSSPPTNKPGPDEKRQCLYKGELKDPGDNWQEGCDYSCQCLGEDGMYSCASRCPTYAASATNNCDSISIPGQCCTSLQCNIPSVGEYNPRPQVPSVPAIVPGPVSTRPTARPQGATPSPQILVDPSQGGNSLPGGGYPLPAGTTFNGIKNRCVFNNRLYAEGETWEPDCDYMCKCVDENTGFYRCNHRCMRYEGVILPPSCTLTTDVRGCCQVPTCKLDNGTVIDPIKNPQPSLPVVGSPGKEIIGSRPVSTIGNSNSFVSTGNRSGCVYESDVHYQGETWDVSCSYRCQCQNEALGLYQCQELCPSWPPLPQGCKLEKPPNGCCETVTCTPPSSQTTSPAVSSPFTSPTTTATTTSTMPTTTLTTTSTMPTSTPTTTVTTATPTGFYDPNCHDVLPNCAAFGKNSCQDPYEGWARKNCNLTCNYCTPSYTTTEPCVDAIKCDLYDKSVCTQYTVWAQKNCRSFCGLCGGITTTPAAPTPTSTQSTQCIDRLNCQAYGQYVCEDSQYKTWADKNCAAFCGRCTGGTNAGTKMTTPQTQSTTPANVCVYNGTVYKQGDTWTEGCANDCSCIDASTGRYVCNSKCPTYPSLPPTCTLISKPGQCCQEPLCNGFEPVESCYYKGSSYSEGAQWTDGCDFECLCVNATSGDFRCKSICPRWNLPSQCTLGDPAPGLCCPTPKCPFTWVPPAGYVPR